MTDDLSKGNDLFNAIKRGHLWDVENIKIKLEDVISNHHSIFSKNHSLRWDKDEKSNFIYDNDCYLVISEKKIELRCDRDNVFSSHMTIEYEINTVADIESAYERFRSMTMEDEDEN